jgi:hypothetical protein
MTNTISIPSIEDTIRSAEEAIQLEQRRITAEIEAYQQFSKKVATISTTTTPQPTPVTQYGTVDCTVNPETGLIEEFFEETVMSVPHYEEDYDESFKEHISAEFTPEVALLLKDSNQMAKQYTSILESYIHTAISERKNLCKTLETEYNSVDDLGSQVCELSQEVIEVSQRNFNTMDFGALEAHWRRLETITTKCDKIAADRQQLIDSPTRAAGHSNSDICLNRYLYEDLTCEYPVLKTIGILGGRIRTTQTQIRRIISFVS